MENSYLVSDFFSTWLRNRTMIPVHVYICILMQICIKWNNMVKDYTRPKWIQGKTSLDTLRSYTQFTLHPPPPLTHPNSTLPTSDREIVYHKVIGPPYLLPGKNQNCMELL